MVQGPGASDPSNDAHQASVEDDAFEDEASDLTRMTDEQRKRSDLIGRLACALDEMAETGDMLPNDAITWKDRPDFEQLLDAWESRKPARQPHA